MELRAQINLVQTKTQTTFSSSFQKKNLRHEEELQQLAMYQGVTARFRLDLSSEPSLASKATQATQAHVTQRSHPPVLSHCCQNRALSCPILHVVPINNGYKARPPNSGPPQYGRALPTLRTGGQLYTYC